jgi:phosphoribosylformylglycinamidine synthase
MFSLLGPPALSQFRLDRLRADIGALAPAITALSARYLHFVDAAAPLDSSELELLGRLLTYGPRPPAAADAGRKLLVTPRIGTVSPWSSKATDIAQVCGLDAVRRLERGTVYFLRGAEPLDTAVLGAVAARLHDRMTESVWLDGVEPQGLFSSAAARPLRGTGTGQSGMGSGTVG